MRKKTASGIMPTLLLISIVVMALDVQTVNAEPNSVTVFPHYTLDPNADFTKCPSPGYHDTSEYSLGSIAVGIILPESIEGTYNWTETEIEQTVTGIKDAMAWWAFQEPKANLSFWFDIHVKVPTVYEPIQMDLGEDFIWIEDVMSYLNYTSGLACDKVQAYNNDIRTALGTDWAFTFFVADCNPRIFSGNFRRGGYAHAFLGGPWVTMSRFSRWAWNAANYFVAVPAHEMGHIFYATDEYIFVNEYSGYLNACDNDGAYGIMNRNSLFVSTSTRLQVGWRDIDEDGIMDILDTYPEISLDPYASIVYGESYSFCGAAVEIPYPNRNPHGSRNNITINKIISVEFSVDDGPRISAFPVDGAFDEALENFTFVSDFLSGGTHSLKIRATNSVGNLRERIFTIEIIPLPFVSATVVIDPGALNLRSKGRWITAHIELPEGYYVSDIDISAIELNDEIPAESHPTEIGDEDRDGILDLMVKFDRTIVTSYIPSIIGAPRRFSQVTLTITGKLEDNTLFEGSCTIKLVYMIPRGLDRDTCSI